MTVSPVTLAEAKAHLNIESAYTADDTLLTGMLQAAAELVEGFLPAPFEEMEGGVPAAIKESIKQTVATMYGNRESSGVPDAALDLLTPYRAWAF